MDVSRIVPPEFASVCVEPECISFGTLFAPITMFSCKTISAAIGFLSLSLAVAARPSQVPFSSSQSETTHKLVLDDEFEGWLNKTGDKWGLNGVAIVVTRRTKNETGHWDGWFTELKGYGTADRWGRVVDENTLFGIGSNSKLFTALAVGMLVEDETYPVTWDTKVKDILPEGEWKLQDPFLEQKANLVDLLSHRTGLPRHEHSYSPSDTLRSLVLRLRYLRPSAEFRQIYQYNNQMYTTASYVVELLTNKTVQEFVTEKVLKPLNMDASTYLFDESMVGQGLADGFIAIESGETDEVIYKPIPYFDKQGNTSVLAGPGGVISNVVDLTRWLQVLLLEGRHPVTDEQIIPTAAIARAAEGASIATPLPKDPSASPVTYGFGQTIFSYQGHYIVEHNGATLGHYTTISRAPYDGIGIAILTNTLVPSIGTVFPDLVKYRLYEKALGLKNVDWESKILIPQETRLPQSPIPTSLPLLSYTGVYSHPAYGQIVLCPLKDTSFIRSKDHLSHCLSLASELSEAYSGSELDFVFSWDRYFSSHVLISHFDKDTFLARPAMIFPPPFPDSDNDQDNTSFAVDMRGDAFATFVIDEQSNEISGIAVKGIWGPGAYAKKLEGTSEATAEVWFERLGAL